ncbi:MAG TPA: CheR family methyltransferase [Gemmatimonadales bacterium]|nr:CheR family methyltransferase [Gemmatimonadales bacterium]
MSDDGTEPDETGLVLPPEPSPATEDPDWPGLLRYLQSARGFDFHGYKPNTLARRIRKRMSSVGVRTFAAYQDYLEVHQDEFAILFNTILINVTSFFRDPPAWDLLATVALPALVAAKAAEEQIRVWSAGCASGEEAYSLAMLLAEQLGAEAFRRRVKIYATDVDEEALSAARHAAYGQQQVGGVPADLLERYFERVNATYIFRPDLRRQVIFGGHDLISDAPISRVDLLVCRNTLMYFNAETQARVLSRFHFALNEGGFLLLGRAETIMAHTNAFTPVDLKRRLSRKISHGASRPRRSPVPSLADPLLSESAGMHFAAQQASPVAQFVIGSAGDVVLFNERGRALFNLAPSDIGRPLRELELSHRPMELRPLIERALAERRPFALKGVEWSDPGGEVRLFDVHVALLTGADGQVIGTAFAFTDVTAYRRLQRELEQAHGKLASAYEELQSSNEELQSTNEELETTNEELQSTVEELETTNEELQSTNEEMETMNEELQAANEELHSINDELRQRGDQLTSANAFLFAVLGSLRQGVVVVDRDLRILAWNPQAEELWGVRPEEAVGRHFLGLDIGLPVDRVRPALKAALGPEGGSHELLLDATNRRGKGIRCEVRVTPLVGPGQVVQGAILLMEEVNDRA